MRRLSFHLLVSLFAFAIGIAISSLWQFRNQSFSESSSIRMAISESSVDTRPLTFEPTMAARGLTGNEYYSYEASDGTALLHSYEYYPSATRANKELEDKLRSATKIIERQPELDEMKQNVGERAVAIIAGKAYVFRLSEKLLSTTERGFFFKAHQGI